MRKLGWVFLALMITIVGSLLIAPAAIRYYVRDHYPGVEIKGDVTMHLGFVELKDVAIDRPNLQGQLSKVTVAITKFVLVQGGSLDLVIDNSLKVEKPSNFRLEGKHLKAVIHKGGVVLQANDLNFDANQVCFANGDVKAFGLHAFLSTACIDRAKKTIAADSMTLSLVLPFDVPAMDRSQELQVSKLKADLEAEVLEFESAKLGTVLTVEGRSFIKVMADVLFIDLTQVKVDHPWVSLNQVVFPRLGLAIPKTVLKTKSGTIRVEVGPAVLRIDPANYRIQGTESCNTWVQSFPLPLSDAIQKASGHFLGQLSFEVQAAPTPSISVKNSCKFECNSELITSLKSGHFEYQAYRKDSSLFTRTLGSANKDWVPILSLPPSIPQAFITLEDPGFQSHNGLISQALENSLKANLQLGRFFRGGSTISMQLAKNLWLRRSKTLGRKVEETLLTIALESCLSKTEILEYYLNAVEFGPNLYGIGPASQHYFHKPPQSLEVDEAFYLASLLPHPKTAAPPTPAVMSGIRKLMGTLAGRGLISEQVIPPPSQDATGWEAE